MAVALWAGTARAPAALFAGKPISHEPGRLVAEFWVSPHVSLAYQL